MLRTVRSTGRVQRVGFWAAGNSRRGSARRAVGPLMFEQGRTLPPPVKAMTGPPCPRAAALYQPVAALQYDGDNSVLCGFQQGCFRDLSQRHVRFRKCWARLLTFTGDVQCGYGHYPDLPNPRAETD